MAAKKSTSKKPAKKAAAKVPAVKKEDLPIVLTKKQETQLRVIGANQSKIEAKAVDMMKLAYDSGQRLIALRDEFQAKFGRRWKEWAGENLPISYEQASRYMKLGSATPAEFEALTAGSLEDAAKQLQHMRHPERAQQEQQRRAANKTSAPAATAGIISNATIEEVQQCTDIEELRGLIKLCHARIDALQSEGGTGVDEDEFLEDDADEAADAVAELVG